MKDRLCDERLKLKYFSSGGICLSVNPAGIDRLTDCLTPSDSVMSVVVYRTEPIDFQFFVGGENEAESRVVDPPLTQEEIGAIKISAIRAMNIDRGKMYNESEALQTLEEDFRRLRYVHEKLRLDLENVNIDCNDYICDNYPYQMSYDELLVSEWCEACIMNIKKRLRQIGSVYRVESIDEQVASARKLADKGKPGRGKRSRSRERQS